MQLWCALDLSQTLPSWIWSRSATIEVQSLLMNMPRQVYQMCMQSVIVRWAWPLADCNTLHLLQMPFVKPLQLLPISVVELMWSWWRTCSHLNWRCLMFHTLNAETTLINITKSLTKTGFAQSSWRTTTKWWWDCTTRITWSMVLSWWGEMQLVIWCKSSHSSSNTKWLYNKSSWATSHSIRGSTSHNIFCSQ